ncbi:MAG: hypothetical protein HOM08_13165 [Candidatus Marinimicrobia bacterium]|nr:hypothetical protein [Candidatus Neomarinimicrobiota bacterium]
MVQSNYKSWVSTLNSFLDELIGNSIYTVYEQPTLKKWKSIKEDGFRKQTKKVGDERPKSINWMFQTIQPSREEINTVIERWCLSQDLDQKEMKKEVVHSVLMSFMDSFVEDYCLFTDTELTMSDHQFKGYRPSSGQDKSKVYLFIKTLQPSRSEIELVVKNWVDTKFGD